MATEELQIEDEEQNEVIESTYIHYNIASYPSDLTLNGIREMWDAGAIVIPPFQRKYVWKKEQASLLIDSFLCGLPVPPVFFYIGNDKTFKNTKCTCSFVFRIELFYINGTQNRRIK